MNKILLSLFVLFIANAASFVQNDIFVVVIFLWCAFLFVKRKLKIDKQFFFLLGVWSIINIISFVVNNASISESISIIGLTLKMIVSYLIVKLVGPSFFDKLWDYMFVLGLLSLPFYIIDLLDPSFMSSLAPILNFMTKAEQTMKGGFYIFFYMHNAWNISISGLLRNCGFMWEPGAYSCVLIFMLVYRMHKMKYKIEIKTIIVIVLLITTFSTSGYISLMFVTILFLFRNERAKKNFSPLIPVFIIIIVVFGYNFYKTNDFMSEKIETYLDAQDEIKEVDTGTGEGETMVKVNRIGIAVISIDNALHRPWGEGSFRSKYIEEVYMGAVGNNSLAELLRQWGWLGLIVLYYSFYSFRINGRKMGWLLPIAMTPVLFSNPFAFRMLIYAIVFSSLCIVDSHNYRKYTPIINNGQSFSN